MRIMHSYVVRHSLTVSIYSFSVAYLHDIARNIIYDMYHIYLDTIKNIITEKLSGQQV